MLHGVPFTFALFKGLLHGQSLSNAMQESLRFGVIFGLLFGWDRRKQPRFLSRGALWV